MKSTSILNSAEGFFQCHKWVGTCQIDFLQVVFSDKVWMYEEMMTNDDNVESSLLTSNLLKICSLYNFCYKLHMSSCRWTELCRVPASMKCIVQVKCVGNKCPFIALQSTIVYMEVQWVAH